MVTVEVKLTYTHTHVCQCALQHLENVIMLKQTRPHQQTSGSTEAASVWNLTVGLGLPL